MSGSTVFERMRHGSEQATIPIIIASAPLLIAY